MYAFSRGKNGMSLKDSDMVTRRTSSRRKFLSHATRAALGALGIVTAATVAASAKDARDFIPADNKAKSPHDRDTRSGDLTK